MRLAVVWVRSLGCFLWLSDAARLCHAFGRKIALPWLVPKRRPTSRTPLRSLFAVGFPLVPATEALVVVRHVGWFRRGFAVPLPAMTRGACERDGGTRFPGVAAMDAGECFHESMGTYRTGAGTARQFPAPPTPRAVARARARARDVPRGTIWHFVRFSLTSRHARVSCFFAKNKAFLAEELCLTLWQ